MKTNSGGLSLAWFTRKSAALAALLALTFLPGYARGQDLYATSGNTILRITSGGAVSTFASYDSSTVTFGLAFNSTGTLFVSVYSNVTGGRIDEISRGGVVSTFVPGLIADGLAFNSTGTLYASNLGLNVTSAITSGGVVSTFASGFAQPRGLVFIGDTLYVADSGSATVDAVSSGGAVSAAAPPGQMGLSPIILATDTNGGLWCSSPFDDGALSALYGFPLGGNPFPFLSGLDAPVTGIAFDNLGLMYYSQANDGIISVVNFNSDDLSPHIFLTGVGANALAFTTVPEPSAAPAVMGLVAFAAGYWRARRKKA